jgi:DNA-binding NarL/FixJ family response regulator
MTESIADVERARDAVERGAWVEAYELLSAIDPARLGPADLQGLADAAWWLARTEESIAARQKAYAGFADAGEDRPAALAAVRLGIEHFLREEPSVGAGWLMRARRHLADQPGCVEHGFVALVEATMARFRGDLDEAAVAAARATEIGRGFAHPDLTAMGIHTQGLILIARGEVRGGLELLDEAMIAVVAGELSPYFTGAIYCNVLEACLELADVGRANEWSEASRVWCESLPPEAPFPALCRINRAEVADLRGEWSEAQSEATKVAEDAFVPSVAARAFYETGEIRRRVGDLAGAEDAFARAAELGFEPQPGMALLRLAQGKAQAASTALRLALAGSFGNRLRRARLLAAQVDVAISSSDLDTASAACEELETIARDYGTSALEAMAATARGTLLLADGDVAASLERLRAACAIWRDLRLPYESALARLRYGTALLAAGDEEDAGLELRAARSTFERLGAPDDAARVTSVLGERVALPRRMTGREVEVLRLVAAGKTNREIAAALVISEHTVARHVQNIFAKLEVSSRSAATAFAFEHGLA